ncbi:UDP-N-acetylglucosamine 2-epimerase (non-hydrolyzing) [Fibrella sp. HMF5335]|uniref:UDP-N-acetylglucosamine 2-epimerase (Non-hydrolyzing) n=1 Tax=Fibrella rubiginis TaxID=2817060 RepID=A0A939K428_9BACT|nr:UDP-N-acetylglucosamine 2-epimerase (non-hydrolyzing) [Fibrella rubiginis]MBO0934960.1 UDP-N-acetylglucosamine 2-epimerase (non-hydrolyzing) [Fibrella rubiginis]
MKILTIVGARPNFMKVAPLHRAFLAHPTVESKIVHTGQHYDARMSDVFFNQLELPKPDYYLGVASGSPTQQTAEIMTKFEAVMHTEQPDWVVVVGDVTSTLACALVAVRMGVRVAHVEAGLRSDDRQMPEEINRILTDNLSDLLFVTEQAGLDNLRREGIADKKVRFVGNVMIDSLIHYRLKANSLDTVGRMYLAPQSYVLVTMHRPANVDHRAGLQSILQIIADAARHHTVLFPIHPRTGANLARFGLMDELKAIPNVHLMEPQGYLEFLNLMEHALAVVTDSGGIQEETTYLQVPCLTFRNSTERPSTTTLGTNTLLADLDPVTVDMALTAIRSGVARRGSIPPLWDGRAAGRIATLLAESVPADMCEGEKLAESAFS